MEISVQFEREYISLKDLVYRRYGGDANSILSMPFFDGCELLKYARDAEQEDKLYMRWVARYQGSMSFEEFKEKLQGGDAEGDERTAEEILETVKGIIG